MNIGDKVKLKEDVLPHRNSKARHERAHIKAWLNEGMFKNVEGAVFLDAPLDGFQYWNVDDLEVVNE